MSKDDRDTFVSIDISDTLIMMDEAISELVSANSIIDSVGLKSDHVQKATFDRFVSVIDGITKEMLSVSMKISKELEDDRNV
jgi:hypothetical protein